MQTAIGITAPRLLKKSHVRVLAVVAEMTSDGGIKADDVPMHIKKNYNKCCTPMVVDEIFELLQVQRLMHPRGDDSGRWICTTLGLDQYKMIQEDTKDLLGPTTSPQQPMRA